MEIIRATKTAEQAGAYYVRIKAMGAGAVVTKDVPDKSLVGGVPAKLIKKLENDVD